MQGIYPKSGRGKGFVLPVNMCLAYPITQHSEERKRSIELDSNAIFFVKDSLIADNSEVFYETCSQTTVKQYDHIIKVKSFMHDLDADLIRSIMFMETSHGWYDRINPLRKTILPMNIHYEYWKKLGFSKDQLLNPKINIHAGALILKRIQNRLNDPKISKIASVYNFIGKESVSDYGARVAKIYNERAWEKC